MDRGTEKLLEMIKDLNPYEEISADTKLIEEGILDSLTLMLLVSGIEKEFGIKIPEGKMMLSNFETIKSIMEMLQE